MGANGGQGYIDSVDSKIEGVIGDDWYGNRDTVRSWKTGRERGLGGGEIGERAG